MNNTVKLCCIHDDEDIHHLRAHDAIGALREIRAHAVRDWGWNLPTQFNLDEDMGADGLRLVVCATLTDAGIVIE